MDSKAIIRRKVKQVWVPYWEWEDWINGMWRKLPAVDEDNAVNEAVIFIGDHLLYGSAMLEVIEQWPRTMLNSLTNPSINKRAFLGHCAVCYKIRIPEYITRLAWKQLTDRHRVKADEVAQKTIDEWLSKYINL